MYSAVCNNGFPIRVSTTSTSLFFTISSRSSRGRQPRNKINQRMAEKTISISFPDRALDKFWKNDRNQDAEIFLLTVGNKSNIQSGSQTTSFADKTRLMNQSVPFNFKLLPLTDFQLTETVRDKRLQQKNV